jgi:hypothetical protein
MRAGSRTFEGLAGHRILNANLSGIGEPVRVVTEFLSLR